MKKSLLFAAIALLAVSAGNAQMKRSDLKVKKIDAQIEKQMRPMAKMAEAKMNEKRNDQDRYFERERQDGCRYIAYPKGQCSSLV